jgi:hypothetical protein
MNSKSKSIIVKTVLKKEIGWSWFIFMIGCLFSSRSLFHNTKWGKEHSPEANFIKPYSLVAMLYLKLKKKLGKDKAFKIMREIIVPVGCNQQNELLNSIEIRDNSSLNRLMSFNNLMDKKGATQFNIRRYVQQNDNICHFKINRCVYKDFFDSAGTPELTGYFCEVDKEFFPAAFPKLKVHRGSSWMNTLAYGRTECDFIFEII